MLESKEAQSLVGIVTDENTWTVTLKQIGGDTLIWPQSNIRSLRPQTWSFMPDGLEQGMSSQDMADLIEYVLNGTR